ncbi:MAG: Hsp20/alpha crystallin family protein [Nitrospirae bacterium]|nr:Hsp20/alpha crystallin family protein [Nitrospirota bacterium]
MLVRWIPAAEGSDLNRAMDRFFGRPLFNLFDGADTELPRADVSETEDAYQFEIDVPGLDKNDLKVELKESVLTVSGEYKEEKDEKNKAYLSRERLLGRFARSFVVPGDIDDKKLKAEFKSGILRILLPKTERARSREIPIQVS